MDTLDLYAARLRAIFAKQAAKELGHKEESIERELATLVLKLEDLQHEWMEKTLKPQEEKIEMTAEEKSAALELLRDPQLLERILDDFERCGVVGEETNKLVSYLAVVSRLLEAPLAVLVQSSSAAGKSAIMEAVLAMLPEEQRVQYSAMTGQSLFYMGETDLKHKVLAIVEEEGASRAAYALKLLQSEGVLSIASTGKDATTGRLDHTSVSRGRPGDALPHDDGHRPGRRTTESVPGADRGRGPRADAGDPQEAARRRRPSKGCWQDGSAKKSSACIATRSGF